MQQFKNATGGTTVSLGPEDSLDLVPKELASGITPEILKVFGSPIEHFSNIAERCSGKPLGRFLNHCLNANSWRLVLVDANLPFSDTLSAFQFVSSRGREYFVHPQNELKDSTGFPEIYSNVAWVNWGGLGFGGQLFANGEWPKLSDYGFECKHPLFSSSETRIFANSPNGDAMICNEQGVAGYISHENYATYPFGQLSEMLDWLFDSLSNDSLPEFDWKRVQNGG